MRPFALLASIANALPTMTSRLPPLNVNIQGPFLLYYSFKKKKMSCIPGTEYYLIVMSRVFEF